MKTRIILSGFFAVVLVLTLIACPNDGGTDIDPTSYTVKFHLNGGIGSTPPDHTVNSGGSITLPSGSGLTKNGYAFGGWNASSGGTGSNYAANSSFAPVSNTTLYAKWNVEEAYTVTFILQNGSPSQTQTVSIGGSVTLLSGLTRGGYTFTGWNTDRDGSGTSYDGGESFTPTGSITLYAQWVSGNALIFHANNAKGKSPNTIVSISSITIPGKGELTFAYANFTGWNTKADGSGTSYDAGSSLSPPDGGITLYAQWQWDGTTYDSLKNQGLKPQLAWVEVHAQNNTSYVLVATEDESIEPNPLPHGTINMSGVTITIKSTGGKRAIDLASNGSMFTLKPGVTLVLEDVTLRGRNNNNAPLVIVNGGELTMENGSEITGNTYSGNYSSSAGGGVYIEDGSFTMNGGNISGNTAYSGGGVLVGLVGSETSVFTMNGGAISGNTATYGGGVYVETDAAFDMNDGTISGNYSSFVGGGVYVAIHAAYTMSGGAISGNTAIQWGGGVYVQGYRIDHSSDPIYGYEGISGTFIKTGGTIYGYYSENPNDNNSNVVKENNVVKDHMGHAIYFMNAQAYSVSGFYESRDGNSGPEDAYDYREGIIK